MAEEGEQKSIKDAEEEDSEVLPREVMEIILMLLPVESLARFKAVSKPWSATISSPRFNIRRLKSHPRSVFLMWGQSLHSDTFFLMRFYPEWDAFVVDPGMYRLKPALPLCSNNGILLLKSFSRDDEEMYLSLMNLTVRSKITILTLPKLNDFSVNHGHFYDSRADDYKVVIITRERSSKEEYYSVYSCRNRIWTEKIPFPAGEGFKLEDGLFVNGYLYWWARKERKLVSFDVREGTLEESGGPEQLKEVDLSDKIKLSEVSGRLCLYCKDKEWTRLRVWVMEKKGDEGCFGAWREMINMNGKENKVLEQSFLGEEDRVLFFTHGTLSKSRYFAYDDETKRFELFDCDILDGEQFHNLIPYSESVFSPHRYYRKVQRTEEALQGTEEALQGTEEALHGTEEALQGTEEALQGTEEENTPLQKPRAQE